MKKAELISQPLIFIFAIIVAVLVLSWGSYQIYQIIKLKNTMEVGATLLDLKKQVDTYYNLDEGSSYAIDYKIPKQIKYFCFTNPNEPMPYPPLEVDPNIEQILQNKGKNVFIIPTTANPPNYNIPHLIPIENPLCIRTIGSLKAVIENKGNYVEIKPIET